MKTTAMIVSVSFAVYIVTPICGHFNYNLITNQYREHLIMYVDVVNVCMRALAYTTHVSSSSYLCTKIENFNNKKGCFIGRHVMCIRNFTTPPLWKYQGPLLYDDREPQYVE